MSNTLALHESGVTAPCGDVSAPGTLLDPADGWWLGAGLSPRPRVRVADMDAYGQVLNVYTGQAPVDGPVPEVPWAVHLTGEDRRFALVVFDLDVSKAGTRGRAGVEADAALLVEVLTGAGVEHVVCESGPTGGRHVWVALWEPAHPELVMLAARAAQRVCPSLDLAPLSNPVTGACRPPGSPHRLGGVSRVIAGDVASLLAPSTTLVQLVDVITALNTLPGPDPDPDSVDETPGARLVAVDVHGYRYLPGRWRGLSPAVTALLEDPLPPGVDTSAVMWRILVGAALARWKHADVLTVIDRPGMEHARTVREGTRRRPRPATGAHSTAVVVAADWGRAVVEAAALDTAPRDEDDGFDQRAGAVAAVVQAIQDGADLSPARWTQRGGGPSERRVLDALCLLAVEAVSTTVEADIRRLGLRTGLAFETIRGALGRLRADGRIALAVPAAGVRAHHWKILTPQGCAQVVGPAQSQVNTPPAGPPLPGGSGALHRAHLLRVLSSRLEASRHDLFAGKGGLGVALGNFYARVESGQTMLDLAKLSGESLVTVRAGLDRLVTLGLVEADGAGLWRRAEPVARDHAALLLGVEPVLAARAERWRVEKLAWAMWCEEVAWLRTPRAEKRGRMRLHSDQGFLVQPSVAELGWYRYPRGVGGAPDHQALIDVLTGSERAARESGLAMMVV